jgi:class 3 adenylate cyclase/CheY-like chemotaxis protein
MPIRVLVVQSQPKNIKVLARFFTRRGDTVRAEQSTGRAISLIEEFKPELVIIDLHLPGSTWQDLLRAIRQNQPVTKVIVTNHIPDLQREMLARELGARVFLREPFHDRWIQHALRRLNEPITSQLNAAHPVTPITALRFPVGLKITLPYIMLSLVVALAAVYLVSQLVLESAQARFTSQLVDTGKQTLDSMVREEDRLLETLRLVANTNGLAEAVRAGDAEALHRLILPAAVNAQEEAVEILDSQGVSLLSLHHVNGGTRDEYTVVRGGDQFKQWDFVSPILAQQVENGQDKYAGLAPASWGPYFYVSGPIFQADGSQVGVVLVGKSLSTWVRQVSQENLAGVTLYSLEGRPLASALFSSTVRSQDLTPQQVQNILARKNDAVQARDIAPAGANPYGEIFGAWEVRGSKELGAVGVALPKNFLAGTNRITQIQVFLLVAGAFILVILVGITLSNQITRPLLRVVDASAEVARGNLEVKVDPQGNDEVTDLAQSFNFMVSGLQEGSIYRDLLGRTVSPEVREQLRQTFFSGNLHLEGQEAIGTVIISDIRGFTTLSEKEDPATIFRWLNEYFGDLVPLLATNGGVINKFDGDAMLAFFGILPRMLSPQKSAYYACQTALGMLKVIDRFNQKRVEQGQPPLATGIGINTGAIIAGGLGTADRLHYTIIGDTVNTTQRLEALTRQLFSGTGAVISHSTYLALGETRQEFRLDPLGSYAVKGRTEQLEVYRLLPKDEPQTQSRGITL